MSDKSLPEFFARLLEWLASLLGQSSPPAEPPAPPTETKRWTFMVYVAGDNNLESAGRKDLSEMKAAGSSDDINIVAQFDRMGDGGSRRYYLRRDTALDDDLVGALPEQNSGDPRSLDEFLAWATNTYPAERYALVLWNHGTGWKDTDIYRSLAKRADGAKLTRGQLRGLTSGNPSRAVFRSTVATLAAEALETGRAILFDDTSADFLDNVEMKAVLGQAAGRIGRKLDLIGCDACLMSMLEVAYQLRDCCHVFVGSEEEEPGDGWPYDKVCGSLRDNPDMSAQVLGATIVQEYNAYYRRWNPALPVTQCALDLDRIEPLAAAVEQLADVLRSSLESHWQRTSTLLSLALYEVQRFTDRDYVDLIHFCALLRDQSPGTTIAEAAGRVVDLVRRNAEETPLIAEGHAGPGMRFVNGIAIYLPERTYSALYDRLDFALKGRWAAFIKLRLEPRRPAMARTARAA